MRGKHQSTQHAGAGQRAMGANGEGHQPAADWQAQDDLPPDVRDGQAMVHVCRSARLTPAAYRFYRAILLAFVAHGPPAPEPATVAALARQFRVPREATLAQMAAQDLVQRDPATGRIRAAYPFSGVPTPHGVALFADHSGEQTDRVDVQVFAMCALDALGIPLMLRRRALITSADALTGEPIRVLVRRARPQQDLHLATEPTDWRVDWDPPSVVIFACPPEHEGTTDTGRCVAATTRCPLTNFFSAPGHVDAWLARQAADATDAPHGLVLGQAQALVRAHERFAGVLDRLAL
jgi:hypothetical protein